MTASQLRVILADDHELLRTGFSTTMTQHGIDVVAMTNKVEDIIELYRHHRPQVVVLEILFQGRQKGLYIIRQVIEHDPSARIVVLSQLDQDNLIKQVYKAGAMAFVPKTADTSQLIEALHRAAVGVIYFLPDIAVRMALMSTQPETSPAEVLSKRELAVFTLLAKGQKVEEIAEELGITARTIANVTQTIKRKLSISRSAELTLLAVRHNIIEA